MKKLVLLGVLLVVAVAIGGGVILGGVAGSGEAQEGRGVVNSANAAPRKVVDARVRSAQVLVGSGGNRRIVGPASFCAPPNGEAIALACALRARAPEGPKLPVRPGKRISLRFGTSVERLSLRYERATTDGTVIALTYSKPVRSSPDGGLSWSTAMSRDPALHRARTIAVFSVAYRDAVRLSLPTRMSKPMPDATAEFAVPLTVAR